MSVNIKGFTFLLLGTGKSRAGCEMVTSFSMLRIHRGGCRFENFRVPKFYYYISYGKPKNNFRFEFGFKNPPDGEFENSEIVKEIKFSKYNYKINSFIKMFLIKK